MVSRCSRITTESGTCSYASLKRPPVGPSFLREGIAGPSCLGVARHCEIVKCDDQHHGREYGRPWTKDAIEPGDVHQQPDT